MTQGVYRFVWGYGEFGYAIVARQGQGEPRLEAMCRDVIRRWQLSEEKEACVVGPACDQRAAFVGTIAFRSRVRASSEGARPFRESAFAVGPAMPPRDYEGFLALVPAFELQGEIEPPPELPPPSIRAPSPTAFLERCAWKSLVRGRSLTCQGASFQACLRLCASLSELLPPALTANLTVASGLESAPIELGQVVFAFPERPPTTDVDVLDFDSAGDSELESASSEHLSRLFAKLVATEPAARWSLPQHAAVQSSQDLAILAAGELLLDWIRFVEPMPSLAGARHSRDVLFKFTEHPACKTFLEALEDCIATPAALQQLCALEEERNNTHDSSIARSSGSATLDACGSWLFSSRLRAHGLRAIARSLPGDVEIHVALRYWLLCAQLLACYFSDARQASLEVLDSPAHELGFVRKLFTRAPTIREELFALPARYGVPATLLTPWTARLLDLEKGISLREGLLAGGGREAILDSAWRAMLDTAQSRAIPELNYALQACVRKR